MPADGKVDRMVIGWIDALIEHAENDVDHHQRCRDQDRRARQRGLERLRIALKAGRERGRLAASAARTADGVDGIPERDAGFRLNEIVTEGNMPWWLITIGAGLMSLFDQRAQRHLLAGG